MSRSQRLEQVLHRLRLPTRPPAYSPPPQPPLTTPANQTPVRHCGREGSSTTSTARSCVAAFHRGRRSHCWWPAPAVRVEGAGHERVGSGL